ncbi:hypothetical protein [Lacticaseibacillus jixiensis]|uniref:hypothetical protein n=1 Tax=Lacticaseibacillus jixiensis TaxID=3231926 RepID=UPI0036F3180D
MLSANNALMTTLNDIREVWGILFHPDHLGKAAQVQAFMYIIKSTLFDIVAIYVIMCEILAFIRLYTHIHNNRQAQSQTNVARKSRLSNRYLAWLLMRTKEYFTPLSAFFLIGRWKLFIIPLVLGLIPLLNYLIVFVGTMVVLFPAIVLYFAAFAILLWRLSMFLAKYVTIIARFIFSILDHFSLHVTTGTSYGPTAHKGGDLGTYKDSSGRTRVVNSDGYARDFGGNKVGKLGSNGKVKDLRSKDNSRHLW